MLTTFLAEEDSLFAEEDSFAAENPPDEDDGADDEEDEPLATGHHFPAIEIDADGITTSQLRDLCGNPDTSREKRLGFMLVCIWLTLQTKRLDDARREAAAWSVQVRDGVKTSGQIALSLFPGAVTGTPEEKASAMIKILGADLVLGVKDLAVCHVSSKCRLTEKHVQIAHAYAVLLTRRKPDLATFNSVESASLETWWPEFPEDVAAEVPKHV